MRQRNAEYQSWGRGVRGTSTQTAYLPVSASEASEIYQSANHSMVPVGAGRSYGDVAFNSEGAVIDCNHLDRFIELDPVTGRLTAECGVRLSDILRVIGKPDDLGRAWFIPVSPGTRFISLGGAIANDVHGKNHHLFGTFGKQIRSFDLAKSDGSVLRCSAEENAELYAATIAGLGLTGVILRATLQLRPVMGTGLEIEEIRFDRLDDFFALSEESDQDWEYTSSWIDCLASGENLGRGVFNRARHAEGFWVEPPPAAPKLGIPLDPPLSLVGGWPLKAFNAVYWRKLGVKRTRKHFQGHYASIFYPLDAIGAWNRLYGPKGLLQFQCAVPHSGARTAVKDMLDVVSKAGEGSMLAVLKKFGDVPSPGMLSFPMPGTTLALDFPNRGQRSETLLASLEKITLAAGGRIYPAKDSLMSGEAFARGYPALPAFRAHIDRRASSSFARRVGLIAGNGADC